MHSFVRINGAGTRCSHSMLSGRHARRDDASESFYSTRFLPLAVLLSATKSPLLSIHLSLLFLRKRRSSRLNTSSSLWTTSLGLGVFGLSDLRCMPSRWNLRWMYSRRSYMLKRLCVNLGVALCRMYHICRSLLWRLRVPSMCAAGFRRFATTRSRLG